MISLMRRVVIWFLVSHWAWIISSKMDGYTCSVADFGMFSYINILVTAVKFAMTYR